LGYESRSLDNYVSRSQSNYQTHANLAYVFAALLLIIIVLMLFTIPLGAYAFFNNSLLSSVSRPSSPVNDSYFFITMIPIGYPVAGSIGEWFIAIWVIFLIFFGLALNGSFSSIVTSLKNIHRKGSDALFDNSAFAVAALFPLLLWATVLLEMIQSNVGIQTGSLPDTDPLAFFYDITYAPLVEELGFRVFIIGLLAFIVILARGGGVDSLKALWCPSKYLERHSTPKEARGNSMMMWAAILFSAVLFGLAHYILSGGAWQVGKISEAALTGVGLGWLYYKYGYHVSVLLHWSFNYFDYVLLNIYFNSTTNPASLTVILLFEILTLAAALGMLVWLIAKLLRRTIAPLQQRRTIPAWAPGPMTVSSAESPLDTEQTPLGRIVHDKEY
jgi:hypothetical protein